MHGRSGLFLNVYLIGLVFNPLFDVLKVSVEAFPESADVQLAHVRTAPDYPTRIISGLLTKLGFILCPSVL